MENLVRRDVAPGPGAFLCSCHFPEGKRENLPVLFEHNRRKRFRSTSPKKKKKGNIDEIDPFGRNYLEQEKENIEEETGPSTSKQPSEPLSRPSTTKLPLEPSSRPSTSKLPLEPSSSAVVNAENYFLRKEVKRVHAEDRTAFSFQEIHNRDDLCKLFTGLPTVKIFLALYGLIENIPINYYFKWKVEKVSRIDQLLICLMKLRQNYPHADLALRFKVSQGTISNIVITWIYVLHEILFKQLMTKIPSRKKNQTCLPNCFSTFTNCRIVSDCTEMVMKVLRNSMSSQKTTYSSYKHKNTWKALIGVVPNGVIPYISTLYPGGTSDKKIVNHSGIIHHFEAGDLIIAGKGFLLKDILPPGVHLNIPPFLVNSQVTPAQIKQTETIARARIHVERAIQRMKAYKILNHIPRSLLEFAGVITQVVGALTNLHYPLIDEVRSLYASDSE